MVENKLKALALVNMKPKDLTTKGLALVSFYAPELLRERLITFVDGPRAWRLTSQGRRTLASHLAKEFV